MKSWFFKPVVNDVFIGYTDLEDHQIMYYPLEEVLIEKMRSVMQRMVQEISTISGICWKNIKWIPYFM
jgi:hypothetical protein